MYPKELSIRTKDQINDSIWGHLHTENEYALSIFSAKKFDISAIQNEIITGCSPCPDIVSELFGQRRSVLFVSTVYGKIYPYLKKRYDRSQGFGPFVQDFYNQIINNGTGIYKRLNDIYTIVAQSGMVPEFCFTELIKTVLYNQNGKVSGLDSGNEFLDYFLRYEMRFLKDRLQDIQEETFVFTFTEDCTFLLLYLLSDCGLGISDIRSFPPNVKVTRHNFEQLIYESSLKRNRTPQFCLSTTEGTFSESVAFKTVFHIDGKDHIHIIPLPHPSSANNKYWGADNMAQLSKIIDELL